MRKHIALILLSLAAALSLTARADDPPQKPTGHPRVIADLAGCTTPYYTWIARDRLLLLLGDSNRRNLTDIATVDLPGGLRKPVQGFRDVWKDVRKNWASADLGVYMSDLGASPDGRRLALIDLIDAAGSIGIPPPKVFSFADNSIISSASQSGHPSGGMWTPDSRQLVALPYSRKQLEIWTPGDAAPVKKIDIPDTEQDAEVFRKRYDNSWITQSGRLFFLSDTTSSHQCELREFKSPTDLELLRVRTLAVPDCWYVVSNELSSDGKYLAWNVAKTSGSRDTNQFWVTEVESGKLYLLVDEFKSPRTYHDFEGDQIPSDVRLQWRPGTTEISYNSAGKLWVVDARPK